MGINLSPGKPLRVGAIHESPLLRLNPKIVFGCQVSIQNQEFAKFLYAVLFSHHLDSALGAGHIITWCPG